MIEKKLEETKRQILANLSAWDPDQDLAARHPKRPFTLDYLDWPSPVSVSSTATASSPRIEPWSAASPRWANTRWWSSARRRAATPRRTSDATSARAHPEGYRKALRLMRLADKFGLPIITLIDTAGAYPGIGAEERHIAEAIAVNLREMMLLEVPIIAVVIGEGGSAARWASAWRTAS